MIPLDYITAWQSNAPWPQLSQVEQDLIICRALVELYSHPLLADNLAFRGGTALFKLHLPPARYSEEIDLVQMRPGPIGTIMDAIQDKLNPWLGSPKRKRSEGRVTLVWRVESEEGLPLRLKIEINSREHFTVRGYKKFQFEMNLFEKINDQRFLDDIRPLLTQGSAWNHRAAAEYVLQDLAPLIPGDMWLKTEEQMAVFCPELNEFSQACIFIKIETARAAKKLKRQNSVKPRSDFYPRSGII